MSELQAFAERIRERFPEGLTGILAFGGTRTGYALEVNRHSPDPGQIEDFNHYADYSIDRILELVGTFFELGGQNAILPAASHWSFYNRGPEYAAQLVKTTYKLFDDRCLRFYDKYQVDPYMVGIDTLRALPTDHPAHQLAVDLDAFNRRWQYTESRRKLIWEIAPIPLFSFFHAPSTLGEEATKALQAALSATSNMQDWYDLLYKYYCRAAYGTELPLPHFYIGTNRNGDLKLRAMLPIALECASQLRLYYTPYPSGYLSREVFQAILEDLAFGKRLRSFKTDYRGMLTPELVESERERLLVLSADSSSTAGMIRKIEFHDES